MPIKTARGPAFESPPCHVFKSWSLSVEGVKSDWRHHISCKSLHRRVAEYNPHADIQVPPDSVCIEDRTAAWASHHGATINKIACTTNGRKQTSKLATLQVAYRCYRLIRKKNLLLNQQNYLTDYLSVYHSSLVIRNVLLHQHLFRVNTPHPPLPLSSSSLITTMF